MCTQPVLGTVGKLRMKVWPCPIKSGFPVLSLGGGDNPMPLALATFKPAVAPVLMVPLPKGPFPPHGGERVPGAQQPSEGLGPGVRSARLSQ